MATASVVPSEELSFENQVSKVKSEIESRFRELMNCVRERERQLLNELEEILNNYKRERDKHKQSLTELETGMNFAKENFKSNDLKQFQESIINRVTIRPFLERTVLLFCYLSFLKYAVLFVLFLRFLSLLSFLFL